MTIKTLLIPTDGSSTATRAANQGFDLASHLDADVHVLSVADSSLATGAGYGGDSPRIRKRLRDLATERADRLGQDAASKDLTVTTSTREGIPAREIVEYATDHAADGIVIGTSGRGGISRALIGSVADKVLRTAPIPVFSWNRAALENDAVSGNNESILIPTDGSNVAKRAAERGVKLAEQLDARVHVLSVLASNVPANESSRVEAASAFAADAVETISTEGQERGLTISTSVRTGRPGEEIVDYVRENGIEGIVMGTHGHGGFERLLLGSVTDRVVRTAPVPVITIRQPEY